MSYFLQGLGIVVGVIAGSIAGTLVTILVQWSTARRAEAYQRRNLKFELEFAIRKIDTWLTGLDEYRKAATGNVLDAYYSPFDLSKVLLLTVRRMFDSGVLYRTLKHSQIWDLLAVFSDLEVNEQFMNSQFLQASADFERCKSEDRMVEWDARFKPEFIKNVAYWEQKLRAHRGTLAEIAATIKEKAPAPPS